MTQSNQIQPTTPYEPQPEKSIKDRYPFLVIMTIVMVVLVGVLTLSIMGIDNNILFNPFTDIIMINSYPLGAGEIPIFEAFKAACVLVALPFFLIGLFSFLGVFLAGVFLFVFATVGLSLLLPSTILLMPFAVMVLVYVMYKRKQTPSQPTV